MKKLLLKSAVALATLMASATAYAHDFEVDGIFYNIFSESAKTVGVTYSGDSYTAISDEYSGEVNIPSSVTYNGISYSVTLIHDDAFRSCSGLTSVTIPNSVTLIFGDAFLDTGWYNNQPDGILYLDNCCLGYKGSKPTGALTLNEGTRLIGFGAFFECSDLTSVTIPNSVTYIGYSAFANCTGLTEISIPNSVTSIGNGAFDGCTGLTEISIPNSVTSIGRLAFNNTGWYNNQPDGILYLDDCCLEYKGPEIREPKPLLLDDGTRLIAQMAFNGYDDFTSITLPNSITHIGSDAFQGRLYGISVYLPNSIKTIGEDAFMSCGISSITIPNSVIEIGDQAFYITWLRDVISLNPNPPVCYGHEVFSVYDNATLYVPKDAFAAYYLDEVWGKFANIKKIETLADSISLSDEMIYLNIGDTHTLNSEIIPAEATVPTICWTSDNPLVATVDENGVVTGVSKGRAAITARAMDGSEVYSTCMVSVEVATSITLSQTEASLPVNDLMTLSYTILPDELTEKTATWSTSNPGVAGFKENADGSISIVGVSNGVATITASTTNGSYLTASCVITVGTGGIDSIESDDNVTEVARYDIHGRLLNEPTPGINIVKMSNGTTRKEIIK